MINLNSNINWLQQQAEKNPNSIAIVSEKLALTYSELQSKTLNLRNGLLSNGIKEGDHVGLLFTNSVEFIITINALWFIGAIPIPLNSRLNRCELEKQIEFAEVRSLIVEESMIKNYSTLNFCKLLRYSEILEYSNSGFEPSYKIDPSQTALILFTSGSTSVPKGVKLSFSNLYFSAAGIISELNFNSSVSFLASLPFYHIGGFSIITRSLIIGSALILPNSLSIDDLSSAILNYKAAAISIVPTALKRFLDMNYSPPKYLRFVFLGGGPIDRSLIADALSKKWKLYIVYGSTETCSMVTLLKVNEIMDRMNCAGKPIGENRILIKDLNDVALPPGKEGSVVVQSKSVMIGYLKNNSDEYSANQYLTDDIGYLDEEGYLYISGRRDDVIISGGENINCREVDNVLRTHPNIIDCYCFGLEDKEWGQVLCAAVVIEDKNKISKNSIRDFLKIKLAAFKIPKKYFQVTSIPQNELGKVNKIKLQELLNSNLTVTLL